ncbi:MAG: endolytic transglycosylase MltG [Candidatus Symbiodolus clandestinus]
MRLKWGICSGMVVMVGAGSLLYGQLTHYANSLLPVKEPQLITINAGSTGKQILRLLQTQRLIKHPRLLEWLWRVQRPQAQFKAGTYRIEPGMSVRVLLQQIQQGQEAQFTLRFVEGSYYQQWLNIIKTAPYIQHTLTIQSATAVAQILGIPNLSIEGWLFPDTYSYTAGTTDVELLRRAYQRMQQQLMVAWNGRRSQLPIHSPYELLILASLIEKETAIADERPVVASVFINRLRRGMRLQSDPTVIYGLEKPYNGFVSYSMLLRQTTSHNTYRIKGLPLTPIAMPGSAALQAAAQPTETDYLYFVVKPEGGSLHFSLDYSAHCRAVNIYRNAKKSSRAALP